MDLIHCFPINDNILMKISIKYIFVVIVFGVRVTKNLVCLAKKREKRLLYTMELHLSRGRKSVLNTRGTRPLPFGL